MQNPENVNDPPTNYYQQFWGYIQLSNSVFDYVYGKSVQEA